MQAVLDATAGGLLYLDDDGGILGVQAAADFHLFRRLGVRQGRNLDDVLPPDLGGTMRHAIRHVQTTGQPYVFEDRLDQDTAPRTVQYRLTGDVDGILVVVHDLTEHRTLEAALLHISERERRRLGEDFHDDIGQTLSGIWFTSSSLQKRLAARNLPEADALGRIADLLQRVMQQFRGLVRGLNTIDLEPGDLVPALQAYAAGVEQIYRSRGLRCVVIAPAACNVPNDQVATQLYRIAQEAITNAVRHGQATAIEIRLADSDEGIRLSVCDDGAGIAPAEARGHGFGLRIMAHRARLIGATLAVRLRSDEGGTLVTCTCSLDSPGEPDHHPPYRVLFDG